MEGAEAFVSFLSEPVADWRSPAHPMTASATATNSQKPATTPASPDAAASPAVTATTPSMTAAAAAISTAAQTSARHFIPEP